MNNAIRNTITRTWLVYGLPGHRQRESFYPSYKCDFPENEVTRIIEVENSDKTGTNDYSRITITRDSYDECEDELWGQITDGFFENSNVGNVFELIWFGWGDMKMTGKEERNMTKAIINKTETPATVVAEHPEFIRFNSKTGEPSIVTPLLAKHVRKNLNYILVRDSGRQGMLKYVYKDGCYNLYSDDMLRGAIKKFISDYDEELVRMSIVNETFQLLITDLDYVGQNDLNSDESLINFKNGLLLVTDSNLRLIPHNPDVYSTIQIPCDWTGVPESTPVFDSYMKTLTDGDTEVEQLLLEFIGACLSNIKGWRMKKSLFLIGDGNTGKSQLKSLTELLLGKGNFIGIDLKEIEARFGTGAIFGTRLAGSSDMSFLSVDELKTFKKITGGDSLFAEFKGQNPFEFTYDGLLWFCMNRLPRFGGDDGKWVYDRIIIVRCNNVIPKEMQDKKLLDKMYAERNGIVYKAIRALQQVIRNGYSFTEPEIVLAERESYHSENSTVISFFKECMCERPHGKISDSCTTGKIHKVYTAWCKDNNNGYARNYKDFREQLADYLDTTFPDMIVKRHSGTFYRNYTLTPEAKNQYATVYGIDTFSKS